MHAYLSCFTRRRARLESPAKFAFLTTFRTRVDLSDLRLSFRTKTCDRNNEYQSYDVIRALWRARAQMVICKFRIRFHTVSYPTKNIQLESQYEISAVTTAMPASSPASRAVRIACPLERAATQDSASGIHSAWIVSDFDGYVHILHFEYARYFNLDTSHI